MQQQITMDYLRALLIKHDGGELKSGAHKATKDNFCVMELVALAAGEPWTDAPQCAHPALATYARRLNDSSWPSDAERTRVLLPLGAAIMGTRELPIIIANIARETTRLIVPIALRAAASLHPQQEHKEALEAAAIGCERVPADAADAAADAAYAAADAARAAYAAADAAYAAADAAADAAAADAAAACAARVSIYEKSVAIVLAEIARARNGVAHG